jgi:hypothetical protein
VPALQTEPGGERGAAASAPPPSGAPDDAAPCDRRDLVWTLLLFAVTVLYIAVLPRALGRADESVYLYEAKRLLRGDAMYRDIFEIITPGWMVLMALLFRVFGTDLATARLATAVIHGLTAILIYLTCRRLGVRRGFAWPAALSLLIVSQPAWPIASQHWLGTLLSVLLLFVCAGRRERRARWALVPGLIIGLLAAVHQQRAVYMALGTAVWLVGDAVVRDRGRPRRRLAPLLADLAALIGGMALVVAPMLIALVASAGFDAVWRALVIHPLFNYGSRTGCEWGHINVLTAPQGRFTFPRLLTYLPAVLVPDLLRLPLGAAQARRPLFMIVFCLASMGSIVYFPDFIHIAFIAPVFFIAIAELLDWAAARIPAPATVARAAGAVAALALLGAATYRLHSNLMRARALYPLPLHTAFGRVDVQRAEDVQRYERLSELLRDVPGRPLFCYPFFSDLYLLADANNPTRYGFFQPGYNSPDQIAELLGSLERAAPPYIAAVPVFTQPDDPIMAYIRQHYEVLPETDAWDTKIYRRLPNAASGPGR